MSMRYEIVSVETYIDAGVRLGLGAMRTLRLYREMGGKIRTEEFTARWRTIEAEYDAAIERRRLAK